MPFDRKDAGVGARRRSARIPAGDGSCMIVVATDAPLDARNLERLAKRALLGIARTGGYFSNGSGDYAVAFSTAPSVRVPHRSEAADADGHAAPGRRGLAALPGRGRGRRGGHPQFPVQGRPDRGQGRACRRSPSARPGPGACSNEPDEARDDRRPRRHGPGGRGRVLRKDRPRDRGRAGPGPSAGRPLQPAPGPGPDGGHPRTAVRDPGAGPPARASAAPAPRRGGFRRHVVHLRPLFPAPARSPVAPADPAASSTRPWRPSEEMKPVPGTIGLIGHGRDRPVGDRRPGLRGGRASRSSSPSARDQERVMTAIYGKKGVKAGVTARPAPGDPPRCRRRRSSAGAPGRSWPAVPRSPWSSRRRRPARSFGRAHGHRGPGGRAGRARRNPARHG
ncbi:MAG: P1 family peptidase [Anaerotruncus sp.]|nr:P1 family peptidase [Anaerotruncus sp.]